MGRDFFCFVWILSLDWLAWPTEKEEKKNRMAEEKEGEKNHLIFCLSWFFDLTQWTTKNLQRLKKWKKADYIRHGVVWYDMIWLAYKLPVDVSEGR